MKISKKDKMVLITLLFVIIIAVFIMYGVMPVSKQIKESEAKFKELNTKVEKLKTDFNTHNPVIKNDAIEDALMSYYLAEDSNFVIVKDRDRANNHFMKMIPQIARENQFVPVDEELLASKNYIETITYKYADDMFTGDMLASFFVARYVFDFKYYKDTDVNGMLNALNNRKNYCFGNIKIEYGVPEDDYNLAYYGTVEVFKYYIEEPNKIPLPLVESYLTDYIDESDRNGKFDITKCEDAPNGVFAEKTTRTLYFNKVEHAEYYRIYEVALDDNGNIKFDENGNPTYTLAVDNIKPEESAQKIKFKYEGVLQEGKKYVVTAVGNYESQVVEKDNKVENLNEGIYYRTIMSKYLVAPENNRVFSI